MNRSSNSMGSFIEPDHSFIGVDEFLIDVDEGFIGFDAGFFDVDGLYAAGSSGFLGSSAQSPRGTPRNRGTSRNSRPYAIGSRRSGVSSFTSPS
jgi:hypothetical protein